MSVYDGNHHAPLKELTAPFSAIFSICFLTQYRVHTIEGLTRGHGSGSSRYCNDVRSWNSPVHSHLRFSAYSSAGRLCYSFSPLVMVESCMLGTRCPHYLAAVGSVAKQFEESSSKSPWNDSRRAATNTCMAVRVEVATDVLSYERVRVTSFKPPDDSMR